MVKKNELANIRPSIHRFASRTALCIAVVAGATIMFSAVSLGEHLATRAIRDHETLIGNDLAASIDGVCRRPALEAAQTLKRSPAYRAKTSSENLQNWRPVCATYAQWRS